MKKSLFRKTPKKTEYVQWLDKNGKLTKYRSGKLLVGRIVNRKTKKVTGFINFQSKESKTPSAQRFTPVQKTILTTPKLQVETRRQKSTSGRAFIITSKRPIMEQIPLWVTKRINKQLDTDDDFRIAIDITGKTIQARPFKVTTVARYINRKMKHNECSKMLAIDILNALSLVMVRMSPKKEENKKRLKAQKINCKLLIMGF